MKQESSVMMRTALLVLETSPASERMPQPSSCPAEIKTTQFAPAALAFSRSSEAGQLSSRGRRGSLPALQIKANQLAPAALACSHSSEAGQLSSRGRRGSLPTLQIKANQLAVAALAFSHSSEAGQLSSRGRRASLPTLHKRRLACESLGSIESFLASRVSIPRSRDNSVDEFFSGLTASALAAKGNTMWSLHASKLSLDAISKVLDKCPESVTPRPNGSNVTPRVANGSNVTPRAANGSNVTPRVANGSNLTPRPPNGSKPVVGAIRSDCLVAHTKGGPPRR